MALIILKMLVLIKKYLSDNIGFKFECQNDEKIGKFATIIQKVYKG